MIEYFNQMKADLLETYKAELCEESVEAINQAGTMAEFIGLLAKFSAFLRYKEIPTIEWVEKWFNTHELRKIANDNGVYFEGYNTIVNPTKPVVVMGNAKVMITFIQAHLYQVYLQNNAQCEITTLGNCVVRVRQKNNSKASVLHKHNLSQIKINKI